MPTIVIKTNTEDKVHWHNLFTSKYYISEAIGTEGIILGQDKPNYSNIKLDLGQYFQVCENTRNNMTSRSVGGISLRPKNDRGSYYLCCSRQGE